MQGGLQWLSVLTQKQGVLGGKAPGRMNQRMPPATIPIFEIVALIQISIC